MIAIGAHVSTSGGLWHAVARAEAIGAEAIQVFGSSPQMWRKTRHPDEAYERFRAEHARAGLGEVWLHNTYLANLAGDDDEKWEKSIDSVQHALTVASRAGGQGVVLHTGSHRGAGIEAVLPRVTEAVRRILDGSPDDVVLALENAAGQGGVIGKSFDELARILQVVPDERLRVCLDTCHAFAAGYDLTTPEGTEATVREIDGTVGIERVAVLHANDSKAGLGENRDRHENIGEGRIGAVGFRNILTVGAFAGRAFLLEVPGFDGDGPDARNVEILKGLRDGAASA